MSTLTYESAAAVKAAAPARHFVEFTRPSLMTPSQARSWVRRILAARFEDAAVIDTALAVASELVANAVQHGPADGPVTLCVRHMSAGVEIAVHDQGSVPPERWAAPGGAASERGHGMAIVEALSLRFDIEMHRFGGKTVTAVIARCGRQHQDRRYGEER